MSGTGSSRRAQDGLVEVLGVAELGLALAGGLPVLRQQANHRLTTVISLLQLLPPPLAGPDAGVRVQIQEDFLGQTGLVLDQPRLDRNGLATIAAGMAHKHPRHHSPPSAQASAHRAMIAGGPTLGSKVLRAHGKISPSARASRSYGYRSPQTAQQSVMSFSKEIPFLSSSSYSSPVRVEQCRANCMPSDC